MRRLISTATLLLAIGGAAAAAPGPEARGSTPELVTDSRSAEAPDRAPAGASLDLAVRIELTPYAPPVEDVDPWRLPAAGPESLVLSLELHPALAVYVAADLGAELPRLDAVDGDTYYTTGVELRVLPGLAAFVEDFQPASAILGADEEEAVPERSWDGHQVGVGLRLRGGRWSLEGAAVFAVLSASGRRPGAGGYVTLSARF